MSLVLVNERYILRQLPQLSLTKEAIYSGTFGNKVKERATDAYYFCYLMAKEGIHLKRPHFYFITTPSTTSTYIGVMDGHGHDIQGLKLR